MLKLSHTSKVDFAEFEKNIEFGDNKIYVCRQRFGQDMVKFEAVATAMKANVTDMISAMSNRKCDSPTPQKLTKALVEFGGISRAEITNYKTKALSADQNLLSELIGKLKQEKAAGTISYLREKSLYLCQAYIGYKQAQSAAGTTMKKAPMLKPMDEGGWGGEDLEIMEFVYEQRITQRYYTNSDNIQGWNKKLTNCITVPDGYYMWWADMKNLELRFFMNAILSLGDAEIITYLANYSDKYEGFIRYAYEKINVKFDLDYFTKNRGKYKTAVIACLYGITAESMARKLDGDMEMATTIRQAFDSQEAYRQMLQNIEDTIRFGAGITITDYFGIQSTVETYGSTPTTRVIDQCANMPIQMGSFSVIVLWANAIVSEMRACGYDSNMFKIYLVKHDELLVLFKPEVMKDMWRVRNVSTIQVDDWDLLEVEEGIGIYYNEEIPELMKKYEAVCEEHKAEFTIVEKGEHYDYRPLNPILRGVMFSARPANEALASYCASDGSRDRYLAMGEEQALAEMRRRSEDAHTVGSVKNNCTNYLNFYEQISYEDPYTGKWHNRADLSGVIDQKIGGLKIFCSDSNDMLLMRDKVASMTIATYEDIIDCLSNGKPPAFIQKSTSGSEIKKAPKPKWKNDYRINSGKNLGLDIEPSESDFKETNAFGKKVNSRITLETPPWEDARAEIPEGSQEEAEKIREMKRDLNEFDGFGDFDFDDDDLF